MQNINIIKPIGILIDKIFTHHLPPPTHLESPKRIEAIMNVLGNIDLDFVRYSAKLIDKTELLSTHTQQHIDFVKHRCLVATSNKPVMLDADTWVSNESFYVALKAIGGIFSLADATMDKHIQYSFGAVRPPGHHALSYSQMGFCLFNNVALLANYLLNNYNLSKVAIIDFDAHHGNGTQQIFYQTNKVLTISLHQYPFWPVNSGWFTEAGSDNFSGFNINLPMVASSTPFDYSITLKEIIIPILKQFEPEFIIFAAGYDSHKDDYISELELDSQFYGYFINSILNLDKTIPAIALLEGGYNLQALTESIVYSLKGMTQKKATDPTVAFIDASDNLIFKNDKYFNLTKSFLASYWSFSC